MKATITRAQSPAEGRIAPSEDSRTTGPLGNANA
jgi:hypothetical protein